MLKQIKELLPKKVADLLFDLLKSLLLYIVPIIGLFLVNQIPTLRDVLGRELSATVYTTIFLFLLIAGLASTLTYLLQRPKFRKLELDAHTDNITGVFNNKVMRPKLEEGIKRSTHDKIPLSVVLIDIDDFKRINDKYKPTPSDSVLREFAQTLRAELRGATDVFLRYKNGDEFMIILSGATGVNARIVAERLRNTILNHQFQIEYDKFSLTISSGVTEYIANEDSVESLLKRMEDALAVAKKNKNETIRLPV